MEVMAMSNPVSTGSGLYLNESDLKSLELKSLSGDKDAAFRVYQYYALSKLDEDEAYKWLERAAYLGHESAQYNWIKLLLDQGRREEAIDWLDKARSDGVHLNGEIFVLLE